MEKSGIINYFFCIKQIRRIVNMEDNKMTDLEYDFNLAAEFGRGYILIE